MRCLVIGVLLVACASCQRVATPSPAQLKQHDDKVMNLALKRVSSEMKGHFQNPLYSDCIALLIQKHNQNYPKDLWATTDDIANYLFGEPDEQRKTAAKAYAESVLEDAEKTVKLSDAFEKR